MSLTFTPFTVPSTGGTSVDDYSLEVVYQTKIKETTVLGTNMTAGAGAQQGDILWIGVMNLRAIQAKSGKVTTKQCPNSALYPGTVEKITFNVFSPFADGTFLVRLSLIFFILESIL